MGSSVDSAKDTINEFKNTPNKYVAAAKVAVKTVRRAVTSPTVFDVVLTQLFTIMPIGLSMGLAVFIIGLSSGAVYTGGSQTSFFKPSNPNLITPGSQCFGAQSSFSDFTLNLNVKIQSSGGRPSTYYKDIGQTTEWIDTGLVTDGEPLEIRVDGEWYPWGSDNTKKIKYFKQETIPDLSVDNPIGSKTWYKSQVKNYNCRFNTDYVEFKGGSFGSEKNFNHLIRYANAETDFIPVDKQIEYIKDVHCFDEKCLTPEEYNASRTVSCALLNGHGVYVKIGQETQYAYHIANYEVRGLATKPDPSDPTQDITEEYQENGINAPYKIPFTLPTKIYDKSYRADRPKNITRQDARLMFTKQGDVKQIEMATHGTDCESYTNSDEYYRYPNETCTPRKNQKIMIKINDIFYTPNDGALTLSFVSGAKVEDASMTGGIQAPRTSLLQTLAFFFLEPIIGKQDLNKYRPGTLVDISQRDSGAVIQARNALLRNIWFQGIRILLLVLGITNLGRKVLSGEESLSLTNILKQSLRIGMAMWGTHPDNYQLVDEVIVPFFYTGISSLFGYLFSAVAHLGGLNINLTNPFACFDMVLNTLFSPIIGYKMLAAFRDNHAFWLSAPVLFCFMIVLVNAAFKAFLITLIGILSTFMLIFFFPIVFVMLLEEKTNQYAQKLVNRLEKEIVTTMLFLFLMSMIFAIALKFFNELFGFKICWERIYTMNIFLFIKINVYGWHIQGTVSEKEYVLSLLIFIFTTYLTTTADDIMGQLQSLIGGQGVYGQGTKMLMDFVGAAQTAMPFVPATAFDTFKHVIGKAPPIRSKLSLTDVLSHGVKRLLPKTAAQKEAERNAKMQKDKENKVIAEAATKEYLRRKAAAAATERATFEAAARAYAKHKYGVEPAILRGQDAERAMAALAKAGGGGGEGSIEGLSGGRGGAGARGRAGAEGERGRAGAEGERGRAGAEGERGRAGADGLSGGRGGAGARGRAGAEGERGAAMSGKLSSGGSSAIDFNPISKLNDATVQRVGVEHLKNLTTVFNRLETQISKQGEDGLTKKIDFGKIEKDLKENFTPRKLDISGLQIADEKGKRVDAPDSVIRSSSMDSSPKSVSIAGSDYLPEQPKQDVKIGNVDMNIGGVTQSIGGVTQSIEGKINDVSKSELSKNMTDQVDTLTAKKPEEASKESPAMEEAREIKNKKAKDFMKEKIKESKETIQQLEKSGSNSKGFGEGVKNLIATASELESLAKKNGIKIDLTSNLVQSSKNPSQDQSKAFNDAQSQAQILSFMLQKKMNKK